MIVRRGSVLGFGKSGKGTNHLFMPCLTLNNLIAYLRLQKAKN